jgi:hypothetical protein
MISKLESLAKHLPDQNHDLISYANHLLSALDAIDENHRKFVAAQALAGISPKGDQEETFRDTMAEIRKQVYKTLEWTIEDLEHKGDKNYNQHYKDGV